MPYEKINTIAPATGQVWTNIVSGDEFLVLTADEKYAYCAVLVEGTTPAKALQVRMPLGKLRSWGNRGFTFTRKHKGKLPLLREGCGEFNTRHVLYGAR